MPNQPWVAQQPPHSLPMIPISDNRQALPHHGNAQPKGFGSRFPAQPKDCIF